MTSIVWVSLIIGAAGAVLALWTLWQNLRLQNLLGSFFKETGHDQFGEVLLQHQRQLRRNQEQLKVLNQNFERMERESHFLLNQAGLVRYNPFPSSGGNMSFSLALLNNNGDGVVITSLHSREGVRIYSKGVKEFTSEQTLMEEEKEAIERAKRQNL